MYFRILVPFIFNLTDGSKLIVLYEYNKFYSFFDTVDFRKVFLNLYNSLINNGFFCILSKQDEGFHSDNFMFDDSFFSYSSAYILLDGNFTFINLKKFLCANFPMVLSNDVNILNFDKFDLYSTASFCDERLAFAFPASPDVVFNSDIFDFTVLFKYYKVLSEQDLLDYDKDLNYLLYNESLNDVCYVSTEKLLIKSCSFNLFKTVNKKIENIDFSFLTDEKLNSFLELNRIKYTYFDSFYLKSIFLNCNNYPVFYTYFNYICIELTKLGFDPSLFVYSDISKEIADTNQLVTKICFSNDYFIPGTFNSFLFIFPNSKNRNLLNDFSFYLPYLTQDFIYIPHQCKNTLSNSLLSFWLYHFISNISDSSNIDFIYSNFDVHYYDDLLVKVKMNYKVGFLNLIKNYDKNTLHEHSLLLEINDLFENEKIQIDNLCLDSVVRTVDEIRFLFVDSVNLFKIGILYSIFDNSFSYFMDSNNELEKIIHTDNIFESILSFSK